MCCNILLVVSFKYTIPKTPAGIIPNPTINSPINNVTTLSNATVKIPPTEHINHPRVMVNFLPFYKVFY